mmetsp:Transcript_18375/g.44278  ORF Transcript_18375/g.44278 Transcript_18375/m.44278 type:complete len:193 (-) Transcript_18375:52-630(-)
MVPFASLAYFPLVLWVLLLGLLCVPHRTVENVGTSLVGVLMDTAVIRYGLKVFAAACVLLSGECLRSYLSYAPSGNPADAMGSSAMDWLHRQEAKEGGVVFFMNALLVVVLDRMYRVIKETHKLALHMEVLKKQSVQQGQFAASLLSAGKEPTQSTMPAGAGKEDAAEAAVRKRKEDEASKVVKGSQEKKAD